MTGTLAPLERVEAELSARLPEGLATPLAARSELVLLKLFVPPLHYGAYLVFMPDGRPCGVVDGDAAAVLGGANGIDAASLVAGSDDAEVERRIRHVIALMDAGLLVAGRDQPQLHWIEPDQAGGTIHRGPGAKRFIRVFYDYFGSAFREGSPLIDSHESYLPVIARYFPSSPGLECLDAGCGSGFYAAALARNGQRVWAADISDVRIAAAAAQDAGTGSIDSLLCDLEELPLSDAGVDFAMCLFVLEHVADPDAVVGELVRVLRPGGGLLVAVPSFNVRDTLAAWLHGELPSLNFEHLRSYGLVPRTHPWCEPTLRLLERLDGLGVRVEIVEGMNVLVGLWEPWHSALTAIASQHGRAFASTWPWNCLGQQTIVYGRRRD